MWTCLVTLTEAGWAHSQSPISFIRASTSTDFKITVAVQVMWEATLALAKSKQTTTLKILLPLRCLRWALVAFAARKTLEAELGTSHRWQQWSKAESVRGTASETQPDVQSTAAGTPQQWHRPLKSNLNGKPSSESLCQAWLRLCTGKAWIPN